jgi:hypothetical protein
LNIRHGTIPFGSSARTDEFQLFNIVCAVYPSPQYAYAAFMSLQETLFFRQGRFVLSRTKNVRQNSLQRCQNAHPAILDWVDLHHGLGGVEHADKKK